MSSQLVPKVERLFCQVDEGATLTASFFLPQAATGSVSVHAKGHAIELPQR